MSRHPITHAQAQRALVEWVGDAYISSIHSCGVYTSYIPGYAPCSRIYIHSVVSPTDTGCVCGSEHVVCHDADLVMS